MERVTGSNQRAPRPADTLTPDLINLHHKLYVADKVCYDVVTVNPVIHAQSLPPIWTSREADQAEELTLKRQL